MKIFVLWGVLLSFAVFAENHGTDNQTPANNGGRPVADALLTTQQMSRLASLFGLGENTMAVLYTPTKSDGQPNELYLRTALEKVTKPLEQRDESAMANIMATLFGVLNDNEAAEVLKNITQVKERLKTEDPEKRSPYTHVVDRIFWAAKVVAQDYLNSRQDLTADQKQEARTPEAARFNPLFREAFTKVQQANKLLRDKVQDLANRTSSNPRASEVSALRDSLTKDDFQRGALSSLLTRQFRTGSEQDRQYAVNLARALGWMDGDKFFADFEGPGGEKQRVHLGQSSEEVQRALTAMGTTFGNSRFARAKHTAADPNHEFVVSSNGTLGRGRPTTSQSQTNRPVAPPPTPTHPQPQQNSPTTDLPTPQSPPFNAAIVAQVCNLCHEGEIEYNNASSLDAFRITKGSRTMTLKEALERMEGTPPRAPRVERRKTEMEQEAARKGLTTQLQQIRTWAAQMR